MPKPHRTPADLHREVLDQLAELTSRPDLRNQTGDVILRDFGLDSFGTFEFIVSLERRLRLDIPDDLFDARRCRSVAGIVEILLAAGRTPHTGES